MRYFRDIQTSYEITEKDTFNMKKVSDTILRFKGEFSADTQNYIFSKIKTEDVFDEQTTEKHHAMIGLWYEKFLSPELSAEYINFTKKAVESHMAMGIDHATYLSIFSYIRNWIHEKIFQNVENDVERKNMLLTFHKFMDIEMSLIGSFYTETEIGKYTKDFSLRGMLITYSEKFSLLMHFILVAFLIFLTLGAVYALGTDIILNFEQHRKNIIIYALGSLLVLWVLTELLHTEIQSIRGGKFKISIFIGVALIAFVRELLILKLQHKETSTDVYVAIGAILALGVVYFITAYVEKYEIKRRSR